MAQGITDYGRFLAEARDAVYRLNCDRSTAAGLAQQEERQERELEEARKEVESTIGRTVKQRQDEIAASYDTEMASGQERLKKARARREKARNKGMRERIAEETAELHAHSRELQMQMRTLFKKERVPAFCNTGFYYALYYPRGLKEIGVLFLTLLACFLFLPCGIYFLIPQHKFWQLIAVYFLDVLLFGGLYVLVGNRTRLRFQSALKQGRTIRNYLRDNARKIRLITRSIQKDGNEAFYDLEKYDDEIACIEQELEEISAKKRDALAAFDKVTKNIISDEIAAGQRQRLQQMEQALAETSASLRSLELSLKEQGLRIAGTYEPYLGKEFLDPDRLAQLVRIIQAGTASNITEAIAAWRQQQKD